jgi:methionine aminopeptidase
MTVSIKSSEEIEKMRVAGRLAAEVLEMVEAHVRPGVSTDELDQLCHQHIVNAQQAIPAPLNYRGFPKSICTSLNHQVCHGIPSEKKLKKGDIVNIASVAGLKYSPKFALYSATKFAVRAFSEGLRNEVQGHNIRVATVNPGMVDTHFFDAFSAGGVVVPADKGDLLKPEDIADAIHFALSRPRSVALNEITIRPYWQER